MLRFRHKLRQVVVLFLASNEHRTNRNLTLKARRVNQAQCHCPKFEILLADGWSVPLLGTCRCPPPAINVDGPCMPPPLSRSNAHTDNGLLHCSACQRGLPEQIGSQRVNRLALRLANMHSDKAMACTTIPVMDPPKLKGSIQWGKQQSTMCGAIVNHNWLRMIGLDHDGFPCRTKYTGKKRHVVDDNAQQDWSTHWSTRSTPGRPPTPPSVGDWTTHARLLRRRSRLEMRKGMAINELAPCAGSQHDGLKVGQ